MMPETILEEAAKIKWFHQIDLGHGIITPGISNCTDMLNWLALPEQLDGKTVLDVGAWDGFFSFEAERRGAARVLATDSFSWSGNGWGSKKGFDLVHTIKESKVDSQDIDVLNLSPEHVGTFDVVLFLGVLYHMKYPLLSLERIASVTKDLLILETHVDLIFNKRPALSLYPSKELNDDPTNFFGPNAAAVISLLKMKEIKKVKIVGTEPFWTRLKRSIRLALHRKAPFSATIQQARMTFHAWK